MKCIDAVEGTAKMMLDKFLVVADEYRLDASEYVRNVKSVIDAAVLFVNDNPEISDTPDLVREVLYDYAKSIWITRLEKAIDPENPTDGNPDIDYQAYCYDYVYTHGNYPR